MRGKVPSIDQPRKTAEPQCLLFPIFSRKPGIFPFQHTIIFSLLILVGNSKGVGVPARAAHSWKTEMETKLTMFHPRWPPPYIRPKFSLAIVYVLYIGRPVQSIATYCRRFRFPLSPSPLFRDCIVPMIAYMKGAAYTIYPKLRRAETRRKQGRVGNK